MEAITIAYKGKEQTVREWAAETGLPKSVILDRLRSKWSVEAALTIPVHRREDRKYLYEGKWYTIPQLSKMHGGICASTMRQRLEKMSVYEAMHLENTRPHRRKRITEKEQIRKFKPEEKKVDLSQCKTCKYHGVLGGHVDNSGAYCDYIGVTLHKRPCPPSPNCTVYAKGKSLVRSTAVKRRGY